MSMFSGEQKSNKQPNVLFRINRRVTSSAKDASNTWKLCEKISSISMNAEMNNTTRGKKRSENELKFFENEYQQHKK